MHYIQRQLRLPSSYDLPHGIQNACVSIDPNGNRMMLRIDNSTPERHP
jgi:hypothetical protein